MARRELDGLLTVHPAAAGLHLIGWLPPGSDDRRVADEASRRGVVVEALSRHSGAALCPPGLLLGYVAYRPAQMRAAMRLLADAVRSAD